MNRKNELLKPVGGKIHSSFMTSTFLLLVFYYSYVWWCALLSISTSLRSDELRARASNASQSTG